MPDRIHVLHVDDDGQFAELTARFLHEESDRFDVVSRGRTAEALDYLADTPAVDCIVSDYALPGMDGLDFLEAVRREHPSLPFIFFTGQGSETVASDALAGGATDYLQKQSGTEQYELLANRIKNAVEQYHSERRVAALERVRTLVRDVNQALVHASSVAEIETAVCELLSEADPYRAACVVDVDAGTMQVEPRTWAGAEEGYFEHLSMSVAEGAAGRRAPEGRAYHDREVAVSQDIREDPRYEPWREAAIEHGFRSLAAVPLVYENRLHGLLVVFAARSDAFDDTETAVLTSLGDDAAHALHSQAIEAERERNERYRRELYRITSDAEASTEAQLTRMLELGCDRLGVENGHIARVDEEAGRHEIELAAGSSFVRAGTVTDLDAVYCRTTIEADDILTVYDAEEEGWADDPAYEEWGIGCYIGGKIQVRDVLYGTLCFVDEQPRGTAFTQPERTFVDLMTRWVSHVFERREYDRNSHQHEAALDAVPDAVVVLDEEGRFGLVNEAMVTLTGYSRDRLLGANASLVFGQDSLERCRQAFGRQGDGDGGAEPVEATVRTAGEETVSCAVVGLADPDLWGRHGTVVVLRESGDSGSDGE